MAMIEHYRKLQSSAMTLHVPALPVAPTPVPPCERLITTLEEDELLNHPNIASFPDITLPHDYPLDDDTADDEEVPVLQSSDYTLIELIKRFNKGNDYDVLKLKVTHFICFICH